MADQFSQYDPSELSNLEPGGTSETSMAGASTTGNSLAGGLTPTGVGIDWRAIVRKIGRGAAWAVGLFVLFLVSAWISLPTRSIAWRISHEARKAGFNITVDDVKVRPWGAAKLEQVKWSFKPSRPDSVPIPFVVEELDLSFSIIKYLLFDTIDADFEGTLDEGNITGAFFQGKDESHVEFHIEDLPLYGVPKLQEALNAPVFGVFTLDVDITAPDNEWAQGSGRLEVHCYSCRIGDGETKLFVPGSKPTSMLSKGVTIPEIDLGTLDGVLEFVDGKAVAEEFGTQSDDIIFKISGDIEFKDPIAKSRLNLTIKIFIEPSLRERSDNVDLLVLTASPKVKMDPPEEGWMAVVLEGNLKHRKFRGIKTKSRAQRLREKREQRQQRERQRSEDRAKRQQEQRERQQAAEAAKEAAKGEGSNEDEAREGREPAEAELSGRRIPPEAGVITPEPETSEDEREDEGEVEEEVVEEEGGDEEVVEEEGGEGGEAGEVVEEVGEAETQLPQ